MDAISELDPEEIEALDEVTNPAHFDELVADMKENRWRRGLPLLVIECEKGYFAWTGSHPIAAAIEAGLSLVPCYVIHERELIRHGGVNARRGHHSDCDRWEILKKVGDETALHLMWRECVKLG